MHDTSIFQSFLFHKKDLLISDYKFQWRRKEKAQLYQNWALEICAVTPINQVSHATSE